MFFAVGIILGVALRPLSLARGQGESARTLGRLQSQEANITKMDWLLMRTELSALEDEVGSDPGRPAVPRIAAYDPERDRIEEKYTVNPTWYARANVSEARSALDRRATAFCALASGTFAGHLSLQGGMSVGRSCVVEFNTLSSDDHGNISVKPVARFEFGKLILE